MELHTSFNILDYIVLGTILLSGLLAILTGFVREMYSLFNWAASGFIAVRFYPVAIPLVKKYISNPTTVTDVSIFAVFCVSFIILALVGMVVLRFIVQGKTLTAVDRSLGFVFGIVRGALIVCLIYLVACSVLWPDIDKPQSEATLEQQAQLTNQVADEVQKPKAAKQGLTFSAPQWLVTARTHSLLAHGANVLREFIPDKMLEKTTSEILVQSEVGKSKIKKQADEISSDKFLGGEATTSDSKGSP